MWLIRTRGPAWSPRRRSSAASGNWPSLCRWPNRIWSPSGWWCPARTRPSWICEWWRRSSAGFRPVTGRRGRWWHPRSTRARPSPAWPRTAGRRRSSRTGRQRRPLPLQPPRSSLARSPWAWTRQRQRQPRRPPHPAHMSWRWTASGWPRFATGSRWWISLRRPGPGRTGRWSPCSGVRCRCGAAPTAPAAGCWSGWSVRLCCSGWVRCAYRWYRKKKWRV